MKRILFVLLMLLMFGDANAQCSISGPTSVCTGQSFYTISGLAGTIPPPIITPSGAGSASALGSIVTVNWNSTFFTGCSGVATLRITEPGLTTCSKSVTVFRKANATISSSTGSHVVKPVQGFVNEYPVTTYSVTPSCASFFNWTVPNGWIIISGQHTSSIQVKPTLWSDCSGQIAVSVTTSAPLGGCNDNSSFVVSRDPVAYSTITNYVQTTGSWDPLQICPDDDIIMDASETSFCNAGNTNIFLELTPCDASWTPIAAAQNAWLSQPAYDAFGGLEHLDVRQFGLSLPTPVTFPANSFFKLKLAAGNGAQWNERSMHIQVKSLGGPAPAFTWGTKMPSVPGTTTVRAIWQGSTTDMYEILYETSDSPLFPRNGTTTTFSSCFTPVYHGTGTVFSDIGGLPPGMCFRYKVRLCNCGTWSSWYNLCPLKPGTTKVDNLSDTHKLNITTYPNPFDNNIGVKFDLPEASKVSIRVTDITGRLVYNAEEQQYEAGANDVTINTASLQSGMYMLTLVTERGVYSHKMMCTK